MAIKVAKSKVDYRDGTETKHCSLCTMWRPPNGCTAVYGSIRAQGVCKLFEHVTSAAADADRNPSDAQKKAGNYAKGHTTLQGLPISIENAKGSTRSGKDGKKWTVTMPAHYGYIKRTEGADGDHVDVYIGPSPGSNKVFLIDQVDADKSKPEFDEHKAMLGFISRDQAMATYRRAFSDGKGQRRVGAVSAMSMADFKAWLRDGDTTKPHGKLIQHFADGGPVEEDDTSQQPAAAPSVSFDDLPDDNQRPQSFDDLQDDSQQGGGFDDLQDDNAPSTGGVAVRSLARGAVTAAGAIPAAMAGAEAGALAGAPLAPFTAGLSVPAGSIIGGLVGGVAGAYLATSARDYVADTIGLDTAQQRSEDVAAHPYVAEAAELAPQATVFGPGRLGTALAQRVLGATIQGGMEAGQEYASEGKVDLGKVGIAAGAGAVMAEPNALGKKIQGVFRPGRPDITTADPQGDPAKTEASLAEPVKQSLGIAQSQPPPSADGATTGNPDSAPVRDGGNDGRYSKAKAATAGTQQITTGDIPPEQLAALMGIEENQEPEQTPTAPQPPPAAAEPAPAPEAAPAPAPVQTAAPAPPPAEPPPGPVGDTGIVEAARAQGKYQRPQTPVMDAARRTPDDAFSIPGPGQTKSEPAPIDTETPAQPTPNAVMAADPTKPVLPNVEIVRDKHIPYLAGSSNDAMRVYVDPSVPETMNINGKIIPTAEPLAVHEIYERHGIDVLKQGMADGSHPKMSAGNTYAVSHEHMGTAAERAYLEQKYGFDEADFQEYQRQMKAIVRKTEKPNQGPVPDDLYTEMYPEEEALKLHNKGLADDTGNQDVTGAVTEAPATEEPAAKQAAGEPRTLDDLHAKAAQLEAENARLKEEQENAPKQKNFGERHIVAQTGAVAGSKAEADARSNAIAAAQAAFDKFPPTDDKVPTKKSDVAAFKTRLKDAVDHAQQTHGELKAAEGTADDNRFKTPLDYKPIKNVPAGIAWLRAAKRVLAGKKSPAEFIADEKLLRSGNHEDIGLQREQAKIEGNMARSRRSGDEAVAQAEASNAARDAFPGEVVSPEDISDKDIMSDVQQAGAHHIDEIVPKDADLTHATPAQLQEMADRLLAGTAEEKAPAQTEPPVQQRSSGRVVSEKEYKQHLADLARLEAADAKRNKLARFLGDERGGGPAPKAFQSWVERVNQFMSGTRPSAFKTSPEQLRYTAKRGQTDTEVFANKTADKFHSIESMDKRDTADLYKGIKDNTPADLRQHKPQEDIYNARERGTIGSLPQRLQDYVNKYLKPMWDEIDQIYGNLHKLDPDRYPAPNANHIRRVAKGYNPDTISGTSPDPIEGIQRGLGTRADALEDRTYKVLENMKTGDRFVVSPAELANGDRGLSVWQKGKSGFLPTKNFELENGNVFKKGRSAFQVKEALTDEIEANARFKNGKMAEYYKNAGQSTIETLSQLRKVQRYMQALDEMKSDPAFKQFATTDPKEAEERGWSQPKGPSQFAKFYMDPHLREVMEDFAKPGFGGTGLDWIRKLSQGIVKMMFWNPVPHMANEFAHWFVERGWDWLTPAGYHSLAVDGAQSIMSVMRQDKLQRSINMLGGRSMYAGTFSKDFANNVARAFGEDIARRPGVWTSIANTLGVDVRRLPEMIYAGSSKVMWGFGDALYTQQVLRNMRKNGGDMRAAIVAAERGIPNYRIPARVIGSGKGGRLLSQAMQEPSLMAFGRYHYAVFNALATMTKDLLGHEADLDTRRDAMGKVFALGLLAFGVKPILDSMAQKVTGNKKAEQNPRGPLAPLEHISKFAQGREGVGNVMSGIATRQPLFNTALEALNGKDWAGKDILEKGDVARATNNYRRGNIGAGLKATGKVATEGADYLGRSLIQPYGMVAQAARKGETLGGVRDAVLDEKNPSQAQQRYEASEGLKNEQAAQQRARKPAGPLEGLYQRTIGR